MPAVTNGAFSVCLSERNGNVGSYLTRIFGRGFDELKIVLTSRISHLRLCSYIGLQSRGIAGAKDVRVQSKYCYTETSQTEVAVPLADDTSLSGGQFIVRVFEILLALSVLLLTSPVMLLVALIIRLDSPGAALFRQRRVGRGCRVFTFYKFRTLYINAKQRFPHLYRYEYTPEQIEELQFKQEDDPRITRAGRWLRKSTLDELPNFWNLLKGDIALVGPRPEIPEMMRYYSQVERAKFSVKPGITGLAQIRGRGNLRFRDTARYDLEYVWTRSFWNDFKIVLITLKLILRLDGAF